MSRVGRLTAIDKPGPGARQYHRLDLLLWTREEQIAAKAIFETKYPDAKWENLHPNRIMRIQRLLEARAALKALKIS